MDQSPPRYTVFIVSDGQTCSLRFEKDSDGLWMRSIDVLAKEQEPFMLPVDRAHVKDMQELKDKQSNDARVLALSKDVEDLKQQLSVEKDSTFAARSVLSRITSELEETKRINEQLRSNLKKADEAYEELRKSKSHDLHQMEYKIGEAARTAEIKIKVACLEAEGKCTVLSADEMDAYRPAMAIRALKQSLMDSGAKARNAFNELEVKYVQASDLLYRVANGEDYYPTLEKDLYKFIKETTNRTASPTPNVAMRLLREIAMYGKNWSYESFVAWFSKVDTHLAGKTIITEEILRGELEAAKAALNAAYPILSELKLWLSARGFLNDPSVSPIAVKIRDFFRDFPVNPAKT